ncbi:MAG: glycosyltransferase domain-containing protein [Cyanophyceae cyanobacterium]
MNEKSKFVVYTVLTGYQENIRNPFPAKSIGYERICFTDNPELRSENWSVIYIDTHHLKEARESRRPKLLPHRFLPDFEYSLYIDNTVEFKTDPLDIFNKYTRLDSSLICFKHPWRDCIYEEGEVVIQSGIDDEYRVREQLDLYYSQGFPKHSGLIAGTVLLRKHSDPKLISLTEEWFEHVLSFSKRDQISFPFVAWHRKFNYSTFDESLLSNSMIDWLAPKRSFRRIPQDFKDKVYLWLNPEVVASNMSPRKHYLEIGAAKRLPYRKYTWELEILANKYKTDKGNLYYNCHGYASVYQKYLSKHKKTNINLLEIGLLRHDVQKRKPGGPYNDVPSLKMWREYFPKAFILGFDIADFSECVPPENVKIIRGDMGKISDLDALVQESPGKFDIIIDDASHASHHQQIALGYLFKHLQEGGFYIIEDLHYQPADIEHPNIKKTIDILKSLERGILDETKFLDFEALKYIQDNIDFIHFYDSQDRQFGQIHNDALAIIKKKNISLKKETKNYSQFTTKYLAQQFYMQNLRIDLGCGANKDECFIGVDIRPVPGVDIVADLCKKFPFKDNSVDEIKAHDIIEHLPDRIHTMNEIWRVCKHDSKVDILVPSTDGRGAFQDPTHVSFWNINSFKYYCVEFPKYLELCQSYGFKGAFRIESLEHIESNDKVIHVKAQLSVVKSADNKIDNAATHAGIELLGVENKSKKIVEKNINLNSKIGKDLDCILSPQIFQKIGEVDRHFCHMQQCINSIHTSILGNLDSSYWQHIVTEFTTRANLIYSYFAKANLKDIYVKRAEIIEFFLKHQGHQVDSEFSQKPQARKKLRLGILSAHFTPTAETFASLPVYEYISRDFEVILYSLKQTIHPLEEYCKSCANSFKLLPGNLKDQVNSIRADDLDILFIATNVTAVTNPICLLAIHRLARVQVTSVASVVTTGIRNIDYYISGQLTDPLSEAQQHYQEKLIKLEGTAHCFSYGSEQGNATIKVTRNSLGISEEAIVFISGANFFKIIPELVHTWAKVLATIPQSILVLLPFGPNWSNTYPKELFSNHVSQVLSDYGVAADRLKILDPQPVPNRYDLKEYYKIADVYLDSFPFSGTTSLLEPLEVGLPIVSKQGTYLRSAMGAALLRSLQIPDLIADSEEAYMQLAIALGTNPELRQQKSEQIKQAMQNNPSFLDSRSYSAKMGAVFQELFHKYQTDALAKQLNLRDTNLIIFPNWSAPEADLGLELQQVVKAIALHPNPSTLTLLVDTTDISEEDANLFLSGIAMNLMMEEDIEVSDDVQISLTGKLSTPQWQTLLPHFQGRIALEHEDQAAIQQAAAESLSVYALDSFNQLLGDPLTPA